MPNFHCCVPGCTNSSRKKKNTAKYPGLADVRFWPLPTDRQHTRKLRKSWLAMIRRDDWKPTRYDRICSLHFVGKDGPTREHPQPTLFPYNNWGNAANGPRLPNKLELLKSMADVMSLTSELSNVGDLVDLEVKTSHAEMTFEVCSEPMPECAICIEYGDTGISENQVSAKVETCTPLPHPCHDYATNYIYRGVDDIPRSEQADFSCQVFLPEVTQSAASQTLITMQQIRELEEKLKRKEAEVQLLEEQTKKKSATIRDKFMEKVLKSDKSCMSYTGFPTRDLMYGVLSMIDKCYPKIKYWKGEQSSELKLYETLPIYQKPGPNRTLSRLQEMTLTLIRLRKGFGKQVLSDLFDVSESVVTTVFTTWISLLDKVCRPLRRWPSQATLQAHQPEGIKKDYPNTSVIIDCAEFFIERPLNSTAQATTYSAYKSHNTFKCLFGISPSGAFIFVSELYGGNISDKHITKVSGFLDNIKQGDDVMADRGFTIEDLLAPKQATLNRPPFTRKCSYGKGKRLNDTEIWKTRKIAKHRIHVERAIQRLKLFKLLSGGIPSSLTPVIDACVGVAASLCNLQPPLAK